MLFTTFCSIFFLQNFKGYCDADDLMSHDTSDIKGAICQDLMTRTFEPKNVFDNTSDILGNIMQPFDQTSYFYQQLQRQQSITTNHQKQQQAEFSKNNYNERGSVDSSDTYISCHTHPFYSEVQQSIIKHKNSFLRF